MSKYIITYFIICLAIQSGLSNNVAKFSDLGLDNIECRSNNTSDSSDDFILFTLNPSGTGLGSGYTVRTDEGIVIPLSATYGGDRQFQLFSGSAGDPDREVTVTDLDDPNCTQIILIPNPGPCSPICNVMTFNMSNLRCEPTNPPNAGNNFVQFSLAPPHLTGGLYQISATNPATTITPTSGLFNQSTTFSLDAESADGLTIDLRIAEMMDATCFRDTTILRPAPCSVNICQITADNLVVLPCDDVGTPVEADDDQFKFMIRPVGTGLSTGYTISGALNSTQFYGNTIVIGPFFIADGPITILLTDNDDPTCTRLVTINPPASCSDQCELSTPFTSVICDQITGLFSYSILVRETNGDVSYSISGDDIRANLSYDMIHGPLGSFDINDGPINLTVTDDADPLCIRSVTVDPNVCVCPPSLNQIDTSLCTGDILVIADEQFDQDRLTGSIRLIGAADSGCDSIINVTATLQISSVNNVDTVLCFGESLLINNTIYNENNPVDQVQIMTTAGCDSIININITYEDLLLSIDTSFCKMNQFITVNNVIYDFNNRTGQETINQNGCTTMVDINIGYTIETININNTYCDSSQQLVINTTTYDVSNPTGREIITSGLCDTILDISLTYLPASIVTLTGDFCDAQEFIVNGTIYNVSNPNGREIVPNGAESGCDSIIIVDYNFNSSVKYELDTTLCVGGMMDINGTTYSASNPNGIETILASDSTLCDSVLDISLSFQDLDYDLVAFGPKCEGGANGFILVNNITPDPISMRFTIDGLEYFKLSGPDSNAIFGLLGRNYTITLMDDRECSSTQSIDVPRSGSFLNLGPSQILNIGEDFVLNVETSLIPDTLIWNRPEILSCTQCLNPTILAQDTSVVLTLTIIEDSQCTHTQSILIQYKPSDDLFIPNAFSVNNDNLNDRFTIYGNEDAIDRVIILEIYNRWGNRVFRNSNFAVNDESAGWDGAYLNSISSEVFLYRTEILMRDGSIKTLHGDVTLIH